MVEFSCLFIIYKSDRSDVVEELDLYIQAQDHYTLRWEQWGEDFDKEGYSELYILVDPSKYPKLLGKMLANTGIPFVHWAFAKARIQYGQPRELGDVVMSLSALLFVRSWEGDPWKFYVHTHFSVPRYQYLRNAIEDHGGAIVPRIADAHIIICPLDILQEMREEYEHVLNQRAESDEWLEGAIESKMVIFTPPMMRQLPGRRGRGAGVRFTGPDRDHLVKYLAERVLNGRGGRKAYNVLQMNLDEYPWGDRHTPASWQGYYRNNKNDIDRRVKKYLRKHPPAFRDGHGAYIAYREASVVSSCPSIITVRLTQADEDERDSIHGSQRSSLTYGRIAVSGVQGDNNSRSSSADNSQAAVYSKQQAGPSSQPRTATPASLPRVSPSRAFAPGASNISPLKKYTDRSDKQQARDQGETTP